MQIATLDTFWRIYALALNLTTSQFSNLDGLSSFSCKGDLLIMLGHFGNCLLTWSAKQNNWLELWLDRWNPHELSSPQPCFDFY